MGTDRQTDAGDDNNPSAEEAEGKKWYLEHFLAMKLVLVECHRSSDGKSTLVQVMASCHQATSHYLKQCWLRSILPYNITGPQWITFSADSEAQNLLYESFLFMSALISKQFNDQYIHCAVGYSFRMSNELRHVMRVNHWPTLLKPLTSLAKPSLNFNGCLAKLRLTSLIKSWKLATDISCHTGVCVQCQQMCEGLSIATCILGT